MLYPHQILIIENFNLKKGCQTFSFENCLNTLTRGHTTKKMATSLKGLSSFAKILQHLVLRLLKQGHKSFQKCINVIGLQL